MQAEGDVFVVVPVYGKGRVNNEWIEGGGERNEPWNSSRERYCLVQLRRRGSLVPL